jgi:hypothetical protein
LMSELGRLPVVGDVVRDGGGIFRIERLEGRRIDRVRYTPTAEELPATETAAHDAVAPGAATSSVGPRADAAARKEAAKRLAATRKLERSGASRGMEEGRR